VGLLLWGGHSDDRAGQLIYCCCWTSSAQSSLCLCPAGLITLFYCHNCDTIQPGWSGSVFISAHKRAAPLYPLTVGFPFVASYDSQGYGGDILTRLQTELSKLQSDTSCNLCKDRIENIASNKILAFLHCLTMGLVRVLLLAYEAKAY
jgi:hypothetical protein